MKQWKLFGWLFKDAVHNWDARRLSSRVSVLLTALVTMEATVHIVFEACSHSMSRRNVLTYPAVSWQPKHRHRITSTGPDVDLTWVKQTTASNHVTRQSRWSLMSPTRAHVAHPGAGRLYRNYCMPIVGCQRLRTLFMDLFSYVRWTFFRITENLMDQFSVDQFS